MMMDINQTYCGDHFTIYTNIKSLICTPETNVMIRVKYTLIKKRNNASEKTVGQHLYNTEIKHCQLRILLPQ